MWSDLPNAGNQRISSSNSCLTTCVWQRHNLRETSNLLLIVQIWLILKVVLNFYSKVMGFQHQFSYSWNITTTEKMFLLYFFPCSLFQAKENWIFALYAVSIYESEELQLSDLALNWAAFRKIIVCTFTDFHRNMRTQWFLNNGMKAMMKRSHYFHYYFANFNPNLLFYFSFFLFF